MENKKTKRADYVFLSAMIRAREARMLTDERLQRALNSADAADCAKIFEDCGYPDMSGMTDAEIDAALTKHRAEIFDELSERPEAACLADLFRLKYDYHNVKVLAKAMGENLDGENALSRSGRIGTKELTEAFITGERGSLPPLLSEAMSQAVGILSRTENPQLADFAVDRLYFRDLKAHAEASGSGMAKKYAELLIDSCNLRSTVRTLRMGKDADFLKNALIEGGTKDTCEYMNISPDGDGLPELFAGTLLGEAARLGREVITGGSMTAFELAADNAAAELLSESKYITFGPEPVLNYLAAVESGIIAVRMVMTGKLYGIGADVIRERMRKSYV